MTNAEKLTLAKHACHIRMGVIEGTHRPSAAIRAAAWTLQRCCLTSISWT